MDIRHIKKQVLSVTSPDYFKVYKHKNKNFIEIDLGWEDETGKLAEVLTVQLHPASDYRKINEVGMHHLKSLDCALQDGIESMAKGYDYCFVYCLPDSYIGKQTKRYEVLDSIEKKAV